MICSVRKFVNINISSNSFLILSPRIPDAQEADASSSSSRSSWWPPSTTETRAPAATTSASGWSGSETGWTGASTADTLTFSPTGATTPAWSRGSFVVSILEIKLLASSRVLNTSFAISGCEYVVYCFCSNGYRRSRDCQCRMMNLLRGN